MFLLGVPLLIFAFAVYNILVFLMPGFSWTNEIWHFRMTSGGEWGLTAGDVIVAVSILILLIEMMKAARTRRSIVDHLLSLLLFIGMVVEFLMVKEVASTTFFLLLIVSFVDVAGGLAIRGRGSRRGVAITEVEHVHPN